jgi:nickel transport protein
MKTVFCVIALFLGAAPAFAHELWVERTPEGLEVRYGHTHSAHQGVALIPYGEDFVRRVDCVDDAGEPRESGWSGGAPARIPGDCAGVFVLTSTGFWSKTTEGTKNVSKKEAPSALRSWQSFESVKHIARWGEALARPFTRDLEITPLENPLLLEPGAKMHLLVTYGGKPVEGATVAYDGEPRGISGKDGRVNLKIRHGGFQMIQAGLTVPLQSEDADEIIHATNLNFEIGGSE